MISRRCTQRQFLLRPSDLLNKVIIYLLAVAVAMFGVELHAACIMSNHLHLVLTDRREKLPEFMRYFMEFTAKCVNVILGRWESVFAPGGYHRLELVDAEAVLDKIAYVLCNPAAAGLVDRGKQWPGVRLGPWQMGKVISARRPGVFFRPNGPTPGSCTLIISKPPAFADKSDEEYVAMVERVVRDREAELREQAAAEGRGVLGAAKVLEQSPLDTPSSEAPHRELSPRVATRNRWHRAEALQRDKLWLQGYREALAKYHDGDRDVVFPVGTYWVVRFVGARCALPD